MNTYSDKSKQFENNENISMNYCDKWRIKDLKNCSGSEDMFSDEEQLKNSTFNSPKISLKNDTVESPSLLLKTPILFHKEESPGKAVVPDTPVGLLPLITKTDIMWTSDMETPESKWKQKSENCDKTNSLIDFNSTHQQCSPTFKKINTEKIIITSPVLGSKKRIKKKAKRRLINNALLELDNIDQQSSISSSSDKVPSDVASTVSNDFIDIETEIPKTLDPEIIQPINTSVNNKPEETTNNTNTNTSTQEFFFNASFSSIDKLCSDAITEKIKTDVHAEKLKENETNVKTGIENDDIEKRVAAIKQNQKTIRRSSDINHTVIPKEMFSKPIRDLELADAQFSQEKKKTSMVFNRAKKLSSFISFSSLENHPIKNFRADDDNKNLLIQKNQEIDAWFDDWNGRDNEIQEENSNSVLQQKNFFEKVEINNIVKKDDCMSLEYYEESKNSDKLINEVKNFSDPKNNLINSVKCDSIKLNDIQDGFSTASGKNVVINESKLHIYTKIYNELESEDFNEDFFSKLKKQNISKNFQTNTKFNKNYFVPNATEKITGIVKFNQVSSSKEFSNLSNLPEPTDFIHVLKTETVDKPGLQEICNKSDEDKKLVKKNIMKIDYSSMDSANLKSDVKEICAFSDGFSTARGKNIEISTEKENYYSKVFEELNEEKDHDFIHIEKNRASRLRLSKPLDKSLVKFNKKFVIEKNQASSYFETNSEIHNNLINDGFSTARGQNIKINENKENYYSKIYNDFGNCDESSLLSIKNKKLSKQPVNQKQKSKAIIKFLNETVKSEKFEKNTSVKDLQLCNTIKTESTKNYAKEILNNPSDFQDIEISSNQNKESESNSVEKCFVIHNSLKLLKNNNDLNNVPNLSLPSNNDKPIKREELTCSAKKSDDSINGNNCKKEVVSQIESLKRKLDACEAKRPERCRSFGGYSANEDISVSKLNKSDPDELLVAQPLQKNSSFSQFFDSLSDSWLSKIEISHLTENKTSKETQLENKSGAILSKKIDNFFGFSAEECVKSFQHYAKAKKAFDKAKQFNYSEFNLGAKDIISISNQTSSKQKVFIQFQNHSYLKQNTSKSNCVIIELKSKLGTNSNIQERNYSHSKAQIKPVQRNIEKRKHAEIDGDTPLTTLKKPRVGCELQGRKLFSDESDSEESHDNFRPKLKIVDNKQYLNIITPLEILTEERLVAISEQEKIIKNKKRLKVSPITGSLLLDRIKNRENRISWTDLVGSAVPTPCTINEIQKNNLDARILEISAANAVQYKFLSSNIINNKPVVSINIGDGACLIFDENGFAGVDEFVRAFLSMPGVDPNLVPAGWIENHYRWIVWKLASIDRISFTSIQFPKMLLPDRVMKELKYRYDREIDRAQRPALRKILEKDDIPSRRLVLCISSIQENSMADDTEKEVITKLGLPRWKVEASDGWYSIPLTIDSPMETFITTGRLKEGTKIITYGAELLDCERGFFPLEKPSNVSLKIHTNCTRRAKWDTKLGYQQTSRPVPIKLSSIVPSGGMIGETTAAAARLYPLLFREKTPDGQSIYRNARSEEKASMAYERARESRVDAIYAEAEKNFNSKINDETENTQGRENNRQKIKEKVESKVLEELPPPRQVTPVLKCRLVDDKTSVILTIWGANEDSTFNIKEGDTITVYNCFAMGMRGGDLNLTANRISHIKKETLFKIPCPSRSCILIPEIANIGFDPKFCEFDTVGVVVSSGSAPYGMKNFEVVNLAYPRTSDTGSSFLSILFWNGISSFGYQNMFTSGSTVACSNLEWRRNTSWSVPVAYCSEKSVFTCNPRQQYLMKELRDLKTIIQNPISYAESCTDEIASELSKKPLHRSNQGTPSTSFLLSTSNATSPADFYSPNNATLQKRIEKLSKYGSAIDMSPIVLRSSSSRIKKDFTPLTRPKS